MQREGASASSVSEISLLLDGAARRLAAAGIESSRLDAQILLAEAARVDRSLLIAGTVELSATIRDEFETMVRRRLAHEPIAYILGRREFYSLEFEVNRDVLIPRPDTETLVDEALRFIAKRPHAEVLDIGTGPGTIAVALAANAPDARIVAADVSEAALATARRNAMRNGVERRIRFVRADIYTPLDGAPAPGRFDLIVSNPPYIGADEIASLEPDVRDFEPRGALEGGPDGLGFFRRIAADAKLHLQPHGMLVLEIGHGQDGAVAKIVKNAGMREVGVISDLDGTARVITARP